MLRPHVTTMTSGKRHMRSGTLKVCIVRRKRMSTATNSTRLAPTATITGKYHR